MLTIRNISKIEIKSNNHLPLEKKLNMQNCYFEDLKFQTAICNGSHDVLMMSMDLKDIDILNICAVDHCCIITGITNSEDMNLLINADLSEKSGSL